jgi:hypothetical protein
MGVQLEQRASGEVRVETGRGIVTELGPAGGRNRSVKFKATHTDLKDPVTGWLDTEQAPAEMVALVERAAAERFEVAYRVEVKRKAGVAVEPKLADLPAREKVRDLVLVAPSAEGSVPKSSSEPAATGPGSSPTPPPAESGAPAGPEAETANPGLDPADDGRGDPGADRARPKIAEGKAWEEHNSDGSPNVGSWAVLAAVGMVDLAVELLTAHAADLADAGEPYEMPPPPAKVHNLAGMLLAIADRVQATARTDGHVSRGDSSHTRARGTVRTALAFFPVPFGASTEERTAWADGLTESASALLRIGVGLAYR